ncbi:MAG: hypothetical protein JW727_03310 [Candidatus Aenigmarchaeota archaeon]|nr:hypothetical protein [Candidatus Aenigmarchaeota archaeon]
MRYIPDPGVTSKYAQLHERGVDLSDAEIGFIVGNVSDGREMAMRWLDRVEDAPIGIISSENQFSIGYASKEQAINIPVYYLNTFVANTGPPSGTRIAIGLPHGYSYEVPMDLYLKSAGAEATVFHYQHLGHPNLKTRLVTDQAILDKYTSEEVQLSDFFVEARKTTDKILVDNNLRPVYFIYDTVMREDCPNIYGRKLI